MDYNPFEPPETHEQRSRRVGRMIRENVDQRLASEQKAADEARARALIGKRVHFAHQVGGPVHRVVVSIGPMVGLDDLPGEFAPHLFVEAL